MGLVWPYSTLNLLPFRMDVFFISRFLMMSALALLKASCICVSQIEESGPGALVRLVRLGVWVGAGESGAARGGEVACEGPAVAGGATS